MGARTIAVAIDAAQSPIQRMLLLAEHIAGRELPATLPELTMECGLAKATVHRMLQQLEEVGLVVRDGTRFTTGPGLRRLAETVLLNDSFHAARHRVLQGLVDDLGESCNLTALSGDQVVYLDRVETREPLRFTLTVGSKVPVHASASGKLLLGQLSPTARRRLLRTGPLSSFTPRTITDPDQIEAEVELGQQRGFCMDNEEFLPGLVCAAVPVRTGRRSVLCVAVQGPALRFSLADAERAVPRLDAAAAAVAEIQRATGGAEPTVEQIGGRADA